VGMMKLVEELYEIYRGKIRGTDEDLDMIALTILEESSRQELLNIIEEMDNEELQYFIRLYILETLKEKLTSSDHANQHNYRRNVH
jgi:Mg/Co/Ni transporter MgtE